MYIVSCTLLLYIYCKVYTVIESKDPSTYEIDLLIAVLYVYCCICCCILLLYVVHCWILLLSSHYIVTVTDRKHPRIREHNTRAIHGSFARLDWTGLGWIGLGWIGLGWFDWVRFVLVWFRETELNRNNWNAPRTEPPLLFSSESWISIKKTKTKKHFPRRTL